MRAQLIALRVPAANVELSQPVAGTAATYTGASRGFFMYTVQKTVAAWGASDLERFRPGLLLSRPRLNRLTMPINEIVAKAILDEAHRAWSVGDVEGVLQTYTDDIFYQCNAIDLRSPPAIIVGKPAMRAFLQPIASITECMSVTESFQFHSGIGRARASCFLKHRASGHTLTTTYRQIVMFRQMRISRMEEFHDAAKLAAFFRLIEGEESRSAAG